MKIPKPEKSSSALHNKLQELAVTGHAKQSPDEKKCWKYGKIAITLEQHEIEVAFRKRSEMGRTTTTADIAYLIMNSVHYVDDIIYKMGQ